MNREFRFRVWHKIDKKWANPESVLEFVGDELGLNYYIGFSHYDYIIQQFTGFHDFNGKAIYEGDILECSNRDGFKIVAVRWSEKRGAFLIENRYAEEFFPFNTVLVVGNIFENLDLLEKVGKR